MMRLEELVSAWRMGYGNEFVGVLRRWFRFGGFMLVDVGVQ